MSDEVFVMCTAFHSMCCVCLHVCVFSVLLHLLSRGVAFLCYAGMFVGVVEYLGYMCQI